MSLATSYRFEAMTEKTSLQNALQRQHERIKTDEVMASREQAAKIERNITLKSEWNEGLQQAAARQKAKNDFQQMQAELKLAGRAAVMVRRAALKKLLEEEYQMFEKELHTQGKAFYIKRT